nr:immunoglobulin light chain junction region [Macaca mulatta]MOX26096.1 immunoglobulin light chain junction region [Macaca mulatta]
CLLGYSNLALTF